AVSGSGAQARRTRHRIRIHPDGPEAPMNDAPQLRMARTRARDRLRISRPVVLIAIVIVTVAVAATVAVDIGSSGGTPSLASNAMVDTRAFLNAYVDPSGRVVRRDQGGD